MIDELGLRFILTGSSARKLKRSGVNLLGGRARIRKLHPLVSAEIGSPDLSRILAYGSLPPMHLSDDPWDDLRSYCGVYLQQEIAEEGISRRIDAFARFLRVAAVMNGELLNFEAFASNAAVPARTIREYYSVLADTLLGELVEPWGRGGRRKSIASGRFWFFDIGVRNALAGNRGFSEGSERWGRNLEHFVYTELRAFLDYRLDDRSLCFWRTRDGREVDFVLGYDVAIEVKAGSSPTDRHLAGLEAIGEEGAFRRRILVCTASRPGQPSGRERNRRMIQARQRMGNGSSRFLRRRLGNLMMRAHTLPVPTEAHREAKMVRSLYPYSRRGRGPRGGCRGEADPVAVIARV